MAHPELLLSNQLCFLIHRLDRAIAARYRPLLSRLGLTYPQYLAMLALWEHRSLGVGRLCELLDLDTGTVSPLLKRMEAQGLVERTRSSDDERSVLVTLAERGAALEEESRGVPGAMAGCLLAGEGEYGRIKELLSGLLARLDDPSCMGGLQAHP